MPQANRSGSVALLEINDTLATAITPTNPVFTLVATTSGLEVARRVAVDRRRSCYERSRRLCEDLAEHLGWLRGPDDPDLMGEVLDAVQEEARSLLSVLFERAALRHAGLPPIVEEERGTAAGLCAIVTALDAEVRLGELGDHAAPTRALALASELVAGVDGLVGAEDC